MSGDHDEGGGASASRNQRRGHHSGRFLRAQREPLQGAVLLAKHELPIESMPLTRALIETNFVLVALVSGHLSQAMIFDDETASRTKLARAAVPMNERAGDAERVRLLRDFIQANANAKRISMEQIAGQVPRMQDVYDGLYRHLSHFAAHPSISAASGHFNDAPDSRGYAEFKTNTDHVPRAFDAACAGVIKAVPANAQREKLPSPSAVTAGGAPGSDPAVRPGSARLHRRLHAKMTKGPASLPGPSFTYGGP
jgi:Family of unknown function (DUF5677)